MYFSYSQENEKEAIQELHLSHARERKILKRFISIGILRRKMIGLPARRFFCLDIEKLRKTQFEVYEKEEQEDEVVY